MPKEKESLETWQRFMFGWQLSRWIMFRKVSMGEEEEEMAMG